jgi:hypothetical protein
VWLSGKPLDGLSVGFLNEAAPSVLLTSAGVKEHKVTKANLAEQLGQIDVLVTEPGVLDGDEDGQAMVLQFLRNGGGLEIAGPGWGWLQVKPGKDFLTYHSGNRMLGDFGIHFAGEAVEGPYSPQGAENPTLTTFGAMNQLQTSGATPDQMKASIKTIDRALETMPQGDDSLSSQIAAMASKESNGQPMPTLKNPITWSTPFSRLEARLKVVKWQSDGPEDVKKDPTADTFPGAIPAGAKRIAKLAVIDTSYARWHAVGLYAVPGEVVTVSIPDTALKAGLGLRIGPQTDQLWHLDDWKRFPEISMEKKLTNMETHVATPFGGLIYIDVPFNCTLGPTPIRISGAVASPLFELGKTTAAEWKEALKSPAPWADLEGKHVSISLPHSAVMNLTDPDALMQYWDRVFHYACDLYQVPEGNRQERYCVDRQIGGGYMHSGYPIMTWEDVATVFPDLSKMTGKRHSWGFYHEMGHNFQQADWTFDGTGEVTNNIFSVYGNEMLNGLTPETYGDAHPNLAPAKMREEIGKYVAAGAQFSEWKENPFLALSMYMQLRIAFGWEPFKHVFAEYRALGRDEHPKTDLDKRDQWMIRFSHAVNKNLGPFFQAWGVPTSDAARQSIADLPAWMPADWPSKQ